MSFVEGQTQGHAKATMAEPRQLRTATMQCLVVSQDFKRGDMICRAAAEGGWEPVMCTDARRAAMAANRSLFHLVLVDTDAARGNSIDELHQFCEQFSGNSGGLLVVCGPEESAEEEIWARRIGAWLYLPGLVDGSGIVSLCEMAADVTSQLVARRESARLRTGT